MPYLEMRHFVEQTESHVANLDDVSTSIRFWQTADHHVGVADSFDLHVIGSNKLTQ
jgi:hypothetical protein